LPKRKAITEGKTKILYEAEDKNHVIMHFKDDVSALKGDKKAKIKGKGAINNRISSFLLKYLGSYNVPTHFEDQAADNEMLVKKVDIIPITVMMRNVASGDLCLRCQFPEGENLPLPILEYYLKNDELNNPIINEFHIYAMKLATQQDLQIISKQTFKINAVMKSLCQRRNLLLIDFRIEFGRIDDKIILVDEISPDTCTFADLKTREILNTLVVGKDLSKTEDAYQEILKRVIS